MRRRLRDLLSIKCLAALALLCVAASIYLIQVRFESRHLQARLNELEKLEVELHDQNRRFMIELTSVTDYQQIYHYATSEHGMVFPDADSRSLVNLSQLRLEAQVLALESEIPAGQASK